MTSEEYLKQMRINASKGGKARTKALSKKRRIEIATKASKAAARKRAAKGKE